MDFDEIFRNCPKWDKEQVIRFWESSGSSGSRLPDNFRMDFDDILEMVKGRSGKKKK